MSDGATRLPGMPMSSYDMVASEAHDELHSGSSTGPVVTNRKQAIAIGLSEQRQMAGKMGHPHKNLGRFLHPKKGQR